MRLRTIIPVAAMAAVALASAGAAFADNGAGAPVTPGNGTGAWTVQSGGQAVCTVRLGKGRAGVGFAVQVPQDCAGALPAGVTAWVPTDDGMALVGADGRQIPLERWSDSVLVAKPGTGLDLSLTRG